jgi:hypothetical protein
MFGWVVGGGVVDIFFKRMKAGWGKEHKEASERPEGDGFNCYTSLSMLGLVAVGKMSVCPGP